MQLFIKAKIRHLLQSLRSKSLRAQIPSRSYCLGINLGCAVWPWVIYLTSLCLRLLICKWITPPQKGLIRGDHSEHSELCLTQSICSLLLRFPDMLERFTWSNSNETLGHGRHFSPGSPQKSWPNSILSSLPQWCLVAHHGMCARSRSACVWPRVSRASHWRALLWRFSL